jgi:hypothetical protein
VKSKSSHEKHKKHEIEESSPWGSDLASSNVRSASRCNNMAQLTRESTPPCAIESNVRAFPRELRHIVGRRPHIGEGQIADYPGVGFRAFRVIRGCF